MSLSYTLEKLYSSVLRLASSNKSIQERLYTAYIYGLIRLNEADDFPEELREEFNEIHQKLTNEGSVKETTTKMSDEEACKIAEKIVSLYDKITRKLGAMRMSENFFV